MAGIKVSSSNQLGIAKSNIASKKTKGKSFGAALERQLDSKKETGPSSMQATPEKSAVQKKSDSNSFEGVNTVGFINDRVVDTTREVRTFVKNTPAKVGFLDSVSKYYEMNKAAQSLVKLSMPLDTQNKLDSFMSDPIKQADLRGKLSTLSDITDNDTTFDVLEDTSAREIAMIKGLFSVAARQ